MSLLSTISYSITSGGEVCSCSVLGFSEEGEMQPVIDIVDKVIAPANKIAVNFLLFLIYCKCYYGNALKFRYQNVGI